MRVEPRSRAGSHETPPVVPWETAKEPSKSAFIRANPSLTIAAIIKAAAAHGISITANYVAVVREMDAEDAPAPTLAEPPPITTVVPAVPVPPPASVKTRGKADIEAAIPAKLPRTSTAGRKRQSPRKRTTSSASFVATTPPPVPHGPRSASEERAFRRLVIDLGVRRAEALIAEVEMGLAALLAGR